MNEILTTIVGNVASAPMRRRTADGTELASFRLASNVRRFDRDAGEWVTITTSYVTVTAWRKLGLNVAASFVKGDPVVVYGRLSTREYVAKDGGTRVDVEIDANAIGPDLSRCTVAVARTRPAQGEGLGETAGAPDEAADGAYTGEDGVAVRAETGRDDLDSSAGEGEAASDDPWGTPAVEPALAG
ncbi:single-stranded DNA-binding protein [Pseudonocardia dioxanivorans]|uniref:single-stranded DNA-binding protein n=1 Tax=Pseudonocardia dioxanivorans TaxID=240495 RepID=UPI000CD2591C|nr:single-stranded DNA-binding protein [Pseudonocardia dioxanivorans]